MLNEQFHCRICSSKNTRKFLDLGLQPWCNDFVTKDRVGNEDTYPLDLYFCENCSTVQVLYTVPKEVMYNNHLYLSGITNSMRNHFKLVSEKASSYIDRINDGFVVDIGSNDGTLLLSYSDNVKEVLGVDPCSMAANIAIDRGVPTDIEFFNADYAENVVKRKGKAQIISAANVFYHVEELHDIIKGIKLLLDDNGVFVMQGSYLPSIMDKKAFDIMYHEHLLYYRVSTLNYLLNMYDLEIFEIDQADVHGGSIVAYICHKGSREVAKTVENMSEAEQIGGYGNYDTYKKFAKSIEELKWQIINLLLDLKDSGKTIYAFGAPAKGTVLLNYCGITNDIISCATEKNELKVGLYIPGTGIPILDENVVKEPDYYLLLSWNFIKEFCESEKFLSGERKFIVPIPEPKILCKKF